MRFALLLLLGALPLIELAILIKIGGLIGFWWTLAIILGTALAGSAVLYDQGIAVMRRTHTAMSRGEPPIGRWRVSGRRWHAVDPSRLSL
jgi:UPF0716 protein FxsA